MPDEWASAVEIPVWSSTFYFLSRFSNASLQKHIQLIVDACVIFNPVNEERNVSVNVGELAFNVDAILPVAETCYANLNTIHEQRGT